MNYIIDPSWVYWMSVADAVKFFAIIAGASGIILMGIFIPISIADECEWSKMKKWAIPCCAVSAALILIGIFIPSQETLIGMKAAELATKENIELTAQQLKELIESIMIAINGK